MLNTLEFGNELKNMGLDFYSGVPCSFLKYLINYAINHCDYVMAANEGDAVAISSGAYLGGRKSVVLMQNSGLTNAVSPLTSLNYTFKIPVLGFVSHRGAPGINDEAQHELMGSVTAKMLTLMRVKWDYLATDMEKAYQQLSLANETLKNNQSFFFIVRKNTFAPVELMNSPNEMPNNNFSENIPVSSNYRTGTLPSRLEALEVISRNRDSNTIIIATTGKTGRELFELSDHNSNLYMVGSMGCASSLGLGLALVQPHKKVVVIDGDGSVLMRMGSLPTIAFYNPPNLLHILLDNQSHDSTGGQFTVSPQVDFVRIASSCGYGQNDYAKSLSEFQRYFKKWVNQPRLSFLYLKIAKGSKENLGRPTIKPPQVRERLMTSLCTR